MADSNSSASKTTIMVIDDQPDILDIVKTILERSGYVVQVADSGMEAFSLLEEKKPDLIILDIMMPQMDGWKVLKQLKGNADYSSIPVILITAKIQQENMVRGYEMGADYFIPKPFTSAHLINITNLLINKNAR
ncbi:MAG: response regulator [Candidatus Binatia bacterium]